MVQIIFISIFIMLLFFTDSISGIRAGATQVEITPPIGLKMYGFLDRKGLSDKVLDPLYVRVLVLNSGERSMAFIVYDLGRVFRRQLLDELRQRIVSKTGLGEVVFLAVHSHSGPLILDRYANDENLLWEKQICEKTIPAVETAIRNLKPAKIGSGWGNVDLTYNRRRVHPDGRVEMIWKNHEKQPLGPVDQTVGVIRIDDFQGNAIAVLANYACHAVIYTLDNYGYSADFIGRFSIEVTKQLPGAAVSFFIPGCAGDINPYYAGWSIYKDAKSRVDEVGKELAKEVVKVAQSIETKPYNGDSALLTVVKYESVLPRWNMEQWLKQSKTGKIEQMQYERVTSKMSQGVFQIPLTVALLTPDIGWVGLAGEFYHKFQKQFRDAVPINFLFISNYTNGHFGYFPSIAEAVEGGYGADDYIAFTEVGSGEKMVIDAAVIFNKLLGRLQSLPADYE